MKKTLGIILALTAFASYAKEGGNGGGGHVCADKVEMYDLFEARERFDLSVPERDLSQEDTIKLGLIKVSQKYKLLAKLIEAELKDVESKFSLKNIAIERTLDADNLYHAPDCSYEQLANWDMGINKIVVNRPLWLRMNSFNQGVLKFHEAAYSAYRKYGKNLNVEITRKFVGEVYSDSEIKTELVLKEFLSGGVLDFDKNQKLDMGHPFLESELVLENPDCQGELKLESVLSDKSKSKVEIIFLDGNKNFVSSVRLTPDQQSASLSVSGTLNFTISVPHADYSMALPQVSLKLTRPACNESYDVKVLCTNVRSDGKNFACRPMSITLPQ